MYLSSLSSWQTQLLSFLPVFTEPTGRIFLRLVAGWLLCTGRRTVLGLWAFAEPERLRAHDAYQRFFSGAAWSVGELWRLAAQGLIGNLCPTGEVPVDVDDTLFHKSGRKVNGAGWWRDAVRSTGKHLVHAWGLNLVVLTLRVTPPWGGEPLGLPVNMRLHWKHGTDLLTLTEEMLRELAEWLPDRRFALCGDGFYASLAGRSLPRTTVTSRLRGDAALYALPPRRRAQRRGRPTQRGRRLAAPRRTAARARQWRLVATEERGRKRKRLVRTAVVLWPHVCGTQPILQVLSRDPKGKEQDDCFFTTDLALGGPATVGRMAGRWSIEDTNKNVKQLLHGEEPQTWKGPGPERAAAFSLWLYGQVWGWYVQAGYKPGAVKATPEYAQKARPSFQDALSLLRRQLWQERIKGQSGSRTGVGKIINLLLGALVKAA